MDIFAITPASSKPLWLLSIICVLLLLVLIALAFVAYASRNSSVEVNSAHIKLSGDFWGREISIDNLNVAALRVINLEQDLAYKPKWRTLGTGLPGYSSGWFKLRNGEKALVYLTRKNDVVYLPTTLGYALMLSLDETDAFIKKLKYYKNKTG